METLIVPGPGSIRVWVYIPRDGGCKVPRLRVTALGVVVGAAVSEDQLGALDGHPQALAARHGHCLLVVQHAVLGQQRIQA
jgi:hypothetical protein